MQEYDLVIDGAGPAGLAVAQRVSAAGYRVCIIDPDPLAAWPNNYGVWVDEFQVKSNPGKTQNVRPAIAVVLEPSMLLASAHPAVALSWSELMTASSGLQSVERRLLSCVCSTLSERERL
jgi:choline dehydrogenase-like flavoprotein